MQIETLLPFSGRDLAVFSLDFPPEKWKRALNRSVERLKSPNNPVLPCRTLKDLGKRELRLSRSLNERAAEG